MNTANLDMEIAATSLTSDLRECAILLDIDGTIVDIAPTPRRAGYRPTSPDAGPVAGADG